CVTTLQPLQLLAYHKPASEHSARVPTRAQEHLSGPFTDKDRTSARQRGSQTRFTRNTHAKVLQVADCSSILLQVIGSFRYGTVR
ncbi:MAG: hypothetical protein K2X81_03370, partial [Candidatus Obscuribacterales bacterium]|nr:hypothetical protein [Candidatus Obscuribacterales bacterium]